MINKKLLTTIIASLSLATSGFSASPSSFGKPSNSSSFGGSSFSKPSAAPSFSKPSAPSSFGGSSWSKAAPAPAAAPKTTTSAPPSNPAPKSSWGVSKPSSQPIESNTDRKIAAKTVSNGGVASREEAVTRFKEANKTKYVNSFVSEPIRKPLYVNDFYEGFGSNRVYHYVYYRNGSYGFWDAMGNWMVYDALSRAAEQQVVVNNYNSYDNSGDYPTQATSTVVTTHHGSFWRRFLDFLLCLFIIGGISAFFIRRNYYL